MVKVVIDTAQQANEFIPRFNQTYAFVLPIGTDPNKHPRDNSLCAIYIRFLDKSNTSVIVPYNHDESIGIYPWFHEEFGKNNRAIFTLDKKAYRHYLGDKHDHIYDLHLLHHMYGEGPFPDVSKFETAAHSIVKRNNDNRKDMNKAIPLLKHMEWGDAIVDELMPWMKSVKDKMQSDEYINHNDILETFYQIERVGIKVDPEELVKHFKDSRRFVSDEEFVFSDYNICTATGRPSNSFGRINFAALNKDDGTRKSFISRYDGGRLYYVDFESYHLRIIADFLDYEFPKDIPVHEYLARQYFGTDKITETQYEESKKITFRALYGTEPNDVPFFSKVREFQKTLWSKSKAYGFLKTPIFKRKLMLDSILEITEQKLFNYFLQSYETELNIESIRKIHDLFSNHRTKTKLTMYLYDGFLFDVPSGEEDTMKTVVEILEREGKYPVRVYTGETFGDLIKERL